MQQLHRDGCAMNFNVYLDSDTVEQLQRLAKSRKTTRNRLIRDAVALLLSRQAPTGWPPEVTEYRGDPGFPEFERGRQDLLPPRTDPLA
jgi:hypothetical protein